MVKKHFNFFVIILTLFICRGNSMHPTMKHGELYTIDHFVKFSQVKIGDIVVFKIGSDPAVVHRVVSRNHNFLITKGDNNVFIDNVRIFKNHFIGRVDVENQRHINNHEPEDTHLYFQNAKAYNPK